MNGKPDNRTGEYNNPAVKLNIETPNGETKSAYAFAMKLPDNAPVGAPVAGYKLRLTDYEKSPLAHVLSIKYDPFHGSFIAWYLGGTGLILALAFVFFVSHQRVWAAIEKKDIGDNYEVVLGGDANRNHLGFEDKFNKLVQSLESGVSEVRNKNSPFSENFRLQNSDTNTKIMSQVLTADTIRESQPNSQWTNYLPAVLAIFGSLLMMFLRFQIGAKFIAERIA